MRLKTIFTLAAIYLAVLGLGFMLVPRQIGVGAVPLDPSPALVAYLRLFGGPFLGIAVLNWLARREAPSTALTAIVLANAVGFGCVAAMDVWGVFGGTARPIAKVFLVIHAGLAAAFILAWRSRRA